MFNLRTMRVSGSVFLGSLALSVTNAAAQHAFDQFQTVTKESNRTVNYEVIDEVYDTVTVKKGARYDFRYSGLNQNGRSTLSSFANFFSTIDPTTLNKDEQLAYWLNFRNLLVIRGIAADLPGRSFKRKRGNVEEPGELWTRKRLSVNGVAVSIDDIEKKIILANWSDPNIIYGLYQGSEGGVAFYPPKNFTGANVHEELAERGRHFVNSKRVIRIRRDKATLPAIYGWYKAKLFGGDEAVIMEHIKALAENPLRAELEGVSEIKFGKMDYTLDEVVVRQQRQQFPQTSGGSRPIGS